MFNFLQYGFMVRGLEAGLILALVAPLIGIFLVLRRYSLIADTLSHVSLAGVALGFLLQINPLITATAAAGISSLFIDKLRGSRKIYGESALALFLSGSLAFAVVLLSIVHGFRVDIFSYLFGSLVTVQQSDVYIVAILATVVIIFISAFFRQLIYVSFDEEAAQVSGVPIQFLNKLLILLAALTVSLAIPLVGVLLISALMVIPVITALQFKKGFLQTLLFAEVFSFASVVLGIFISFALNLATGGTIVLLALGFFGVTLLFTAGE